MATKTREYLLDKCKIYNLPTVGTNAHLAKLIAKAARSQYDLLQCTNQTTTAITLHHLLQQRVDVIDRHGQRHNGLLVRNRATYQYDVMDGGTIANSFDKDTVHKVEYRKGWMVWTK